MNTAARPGHRITLRLQLAVLGVVWSWALGAGAAQAQTGAGAAPDPRRVDYIVAVVNRELVTAVEVERRAERLAEEARRAPAGTAPAGEEALRRLALESLVEERVVLTHARETGGRVESAEIDRAVQAIAAQNQLSVDGLRERLAAEGTEMPRFRANLRDQLLVERVREREVLARIRITDLEIDTLLQQERESQDLDVELAQILVRVPDGAGEAVVEDRRRRAEILLARVRSGEPFEAVAKAESDDASRENGGSLGRRPVSRLPDVFVQALRALRPGEVRAEVLRTGAGFHLLKLLWREEATAGRMTQTRVRHILLRQSARLTTPEAIARLSGWRRQIDSGLRRFEDTAREFSEDSSAAQGGDLGWASPGMMVPEFEQAMNDLRVGGLSDPVVSRFGVHLIQVLDRREVEIDARQQRERARAALREQKFEAAYRDWVRELRDRAYVEWRDPPP